ncbi:MAG TPA: hypothetical protein PKA71_06870, partial [Saprospiraceae bacterium]|nr:hypothetical protein [Saprospiraceae bacterium]
MPILSLLFNGSFINNSKGTLISVDLIQDFLRKQLKQSELAELFLVTKNGLILSHSEEGPLLDYSQKAFP